MNNKKKTKLSGKGLYIALVLCVAVVGITGVMLVTSGGDPFGYATNPPTDIPVIPTWPAPVSQNPRQNEDELPVAKPTEVPDVSPPPAVSPAPPTIAPPSQKPVSDPTSIPSDKPSATPTQKPKVQFLWPVVGEAVTAFSDDQLIYDKTMGDWRVHLGLDISAAEGSEVVASADGKIMDIYEDAFWGTTVVIEHADGYTTRYSNLMKKPVVTVGKNVKAGDTVGGVGTTAQAERREIPHLHFVILKDNKPINPADKLPVIG